MSLEIKFESIAVSRLHQLGVATINARKTRLVSGRCNVDAKKTSWIKVAFMPITHQPIATLLDI
jgi:hypothetical protein